MKHALIIALLVIAVFGCAAGNAAMTSLPSDALISPPDPSLGQLAKYSGIWAGEYDTSYPLNITVAVERISQKEVIIYYSFWSHQMLQGGGMRLFGKVIGDSLFFEWGGDGLKRRLSLTLVGDKILAEFRRDGSAVKNRAVLTKAPSPAPR